MSTLLYQAGRSLSTNSTGAGDLVVSTACAAIEGESDDRAVRVMVSFTFQSTPAGIVTASVTVNKSQDLTTAVAGLTACGHAPPSSDSVTVSEATSLILRTVTVCVTRSPGRATRVSPSKYSSSPAAWRGLAK